MTVMSTVKLELKRLAIRHCPALLADHWLRTQRCEREAFCLRFLCDPTRLAIDIGGLEGQYTAIALAYSKRCYTFEPQPQRAAQIRHLLGRVADRVVVEQVALSDRAGVTTMKVPRHDPGKATIAPSNPLENLSDIEEIEVRCRRLDEYKLRDVGFMKIDVEGHEEAVIKGAEETITLNKPNLLIEIEERHNVGGLARLSALFKDWGYESHFMTKNGIHPLSDFSLREHQGDPQLAGTDRYINNFIFASDPKTLLTLRTKSLVDRS